MALELELELPELEPEPEPPGQPEPPPLAAFVLASASRQSCLKTWICPHPNRPRLVLTLADP